MDEIYNDGNRNRGNNLSKKFYTVPYSLSFNHNTFPITTNQFSENRFSCLENDIQTLFLDESNFADKSKVIEALINKMIETRKNKIRRCHVTRVKFDAFIRCNYRIK
jgi:hypothetical protein